MKKRTEEGLATPIASLIDVVFLLIIFFVVTASVEKDLIDETIQLAQASNVKAVEKKNPETITINLHNDGRLNIAMRPLSLGQLKQVLMATVARTGNRTPVLIRCDANTEYDKVDEVMSVVGKAGLYKVKISAVSTR